MLLKYDIVVILGFSRVYSFDQAQNHGDSAMFTGGGGAGCRGELCCIM